MAAVVVAILGATAAGIGAERRWGARGRAATRRILDVMLYAVLPFVAFLVVARLELTAGVGAGLAFGYVVALTAGALAWIAGEHVLRLPRPSTGSLVITSMQGNHGYLGVPLVATLVGPDQIGAAVAYDTVVSNPLMYLGSFAIGAALGARAGEPRASARGRTSAATPCCSGSSPGCSHRTRSRPRRRSTSPAPWRSACSRSASSCSA
jgi:malate permease and related proteins